MLDIGWQELFIIAIFTILVIGPKDLPRVLKTVMQWIRKARGLAREFQGGVDEMVREAELDDVKKDIRKLTDPGDLKTSIADTIDPTGELNGIQKDLDKTAREAAKDDEPEEENPFKNKSGDELRALIEKEKQKKATAEAEGERKRVEAEAGQKADDANAEASEATNTDTNSEADKEKS